MAKGDAKPGVRGHSHLAKPKSVAAKVKAKVKAKPKAKKE